MAKPAPKVKSRPPGTTKAVLRGRTKPVTQPKPFVGVPHTVTRLMALKPGQSLRYYRGSMDDLDREHTPLHNQILHQVFACAARLQDKGRVLLQEVPYGLKFQMPMADGKVATVTINMTDYVATGLAHD